jgi:hypothetical protein
MRALWDRYPELPYRAVVPWPVVEINGNLDWIASVDLVESWLESRIGPHYVRWTWNMWTLHNYDLCGVAFARASDTTLFLLRWDTAGY